MTTREHLARLQTHAWARAAWNFRQAELAKAAGDREAFWRYRRLGLKHQAVGYCLRREVSHE